MTSVNVFDPATFAPVSNVVNNADGSREHWSFRGLTVDGHLTPAGQNATETVRNFQLPEPAYDLNCCMRSLLPAAVRLRVGDSFTLPGVVESEGDPDRATFHVTARERIRAGYKGMVDAWVVET